MLLRKRFWFISFYSIEINRRIDRLHYVLFRLPLVSQVLFQAFPFPQYTNDQSPRNMFAMLAYYVVMLTVGILSLRLISDIVEEKDSGVKVRFTHE